MLAAAQRTSGVTDSYKDLVKNYCESACSKAKKATKPKPTSTTPFFSATLLLLPHVLCFHHVNFQLNFAKYRRNLKGYTKSTPNTQVIGFTDADSHLMS